MGDPALPGATAAAVVAQAEAAASLAAGAELPRAVGPPAGARASPAEPAAAAEVTSADIVRWTGQVEREFRFIKGDISIVSSKIDELAASTSPLKDVVATCSAQSAHLEISMQQFGDNPADRGGASRGGGDARERLPKNKKQKSRSLATTLLHGRNPRRGSTGSLGVGFRRTSATLLLTLRPLWARASA